MHVQAPEVLWHYTSADAAAKIIMGQHLWATSVHYLNDSEEFAVGRGLAVATLAEQLRKRGDSTDPNVRAAALGFLETYDPNVFVASLTEERDLLSQWVAYCPRGGYALGFRTSALASYMRSRFGVHLVRCEYTDRAETHAMVDKAAQQVVCMIPSTDPATSPCSLESWPGLFHSHGPFFFRDTLLRVKDKAFAAEREWRLVARDGTAADGEGPMRLQVMFRGAGGVVVPYCEMRLCKPHNKVPLAGVVVAPSARADLAREGMVRLLRSLEMDDAAKAVVLSDVPYRPVAV